MARLVGSEFMLLSRSSITVYILRGACDSMVAIKWMIMIEFEAHSRRSLVLLEDQSLVFSV